MVTISANLYGDKCAALVLLSGLIFWVLFVLFNMYDLFSLSQYFATSLFLKYGMSAYQVSTYFPCFVVFLSWMNQYSNIF